VDFLTKIEVLKQLQNAVSEYDDTQAVSLTKEALNQEVAPLKIIEDGLANPVREVGEKFGKGEIFLMDLVAAANVMEVCMEILQPTLEKSGIKRNVIGKIVFGTVEGDIHDIGKNIVIAMLRASGFEVIDLGKDVPTEHFIKKARETKPNIIAVSSLLTTTMLKQKELIESLKKEGLRDSVKVIIGGAPCSTEWANEIGADGYGAEANDAVKLAKSLVA